MIKIFVNELGEIHDVYTNSRNDPSLIEVTVVDNTFDGWSRAKICCYKVNVSPEGHITMMTPYVDSRLIEHIDQLGYQVDSITPYTQTKSIYIDETSVTFSDVPYGNLSIYIEGENGVCPTYTYRREDSNVIISFEEPLKYVAKATITVN